MVVFNSFLSLILLLFDVTECVETSINSIKKWVILNCSLSNLGSRPEVSIKQRERVSPMHTGDTVVKDMSFKMQWILHSAVTNHNGIQI